jgi:hypothetical protein
MLMVAQEKTAWPVRYSDLDFTRDSEVRVIPFIEASSEVSWF